MFTKAPILQHFDPECHIRIETNVSGYAIKRVLGHLTFDHLNSNQSQWHPVTYILKKMIPFEMKYKTHNSELLAIVEDFKIWLYYMKSCKHKVLLFTNHNNLCWLMDAKSLSSRQVQWA